MCGRYELNFALQDLPKILKRNLPKNFSNYYSPQLLIKPTDPVLVLRQEHSKISSSFMLWGLLADWTKDPLNAPRPFNARSETIRTKSMFRSAWRHRRCLLPASAFLEKANRFRRRDFKPFFFAGIWNRWLGSDGSEIESCAIITTQANSFIKPFHNRMPVIIPKGLEDIWLNDAYGNDLRFLERLLINGIEQNDWQVESLFKSNFLVDQMSLF